MTFFQVATRGLLRRPVRTGLTLLGISIGIAAVVALVGLSRGFETSWQAGMSQRGTDMVVSNMGSSLTPKPFSASVRDRIARLPRVAGTSMLLVELMSVESAEMVIVSGREWDGFSWSNVKVLSGRLPKDGRERAVVLGTTAAEVLKKKVGDEVQIEAESLPVVGIVDGGAVVENGAIILSLPVLQEVTGNQGKINLVDLRLAPGTDAQQISRLREDVTAAAPGLRAVPAAEHIRNSQGYRVLRAMSWGTSLLAVLVGVLGVMNTMLMTVSERKKEVSVLLALGWRRGRVISLIVLESALLGFLGGLAGVVIGTIGVKALAASPNVRGLLAPDTGLALMLPAMAMALGVGILSGLYPAWKSSRLQPSLAMQG